MSSPYSTTTNCSSSSRDSYTRRQKEAIEFHLSQFVAEGPVHFLMLGLMMNVPYLKLFEWLNTAEPLTFKYQLLLSYLSTFIGDDFYGQFYHVMDQMGCGQVFQNYVENHPFLKDFFKVAYKHAPPQERESLALLLALKVCKHGQRKMGFEYYMKQEMNGAFLFLNSPEPLDVLELFQMACEGYKKFSLYRYLGKLRKIIDMCGLDDEFFHEFIDLYLPLYSM